MYIYLGANGRIICFRIHDTANVIILSTFCEGLKCICIICFITVAVVELRHCSYKNELDELHSSVIPNKMVDDYNNDLHKTIINFM